MRLARKVRLSKRNLKRAEQDLAFATATKFHELAKGGTNTNFSDMIFGGPPLTAYPPGYDSSQEDWLRRNDARILAAYALPRSLLGPEQARAQGLLYAGIEPGGSSARRYQSLIEDANIRRNKMPLNNFNWSVIDGHILIEVECQKIIVHDKKELKAAIAKLVDDQLWPLIKEKLDDQKRRK